MRVGKEIDLNGLAAGADLIFEDDFDLDIPREIAGFLADFMDALFFFHKRLFPIDAFRLGMDDGLKGKDFAGFGVFDVPLQVQVEHLDFSEDALAVFAIAFEQPSGKSDILIDAFRYAYMGNRLWVRRLLSFWRWLWGGFGRWLWGRRRRRNDFP